MANNLYTAIIETDGELKTSQVISEHDLEEVKRSCESRFPGGRVIEVKERGQ